MNQTLYQTTIDTPLGQMTACATEQGLCMLEFPLIERINSHVNALTKALNTPVKLTNESKHPLFLSLREQLKSYFNKDLHNFDLPLFFTGTDFQKKTWTSLLQIPYGKTCSYSEQACAIGKPTAMRAVAAANGRNKISIIVPCHRVIGSNGSLTGYGGELWRKKSLLELEQA
ncbi:MAG: methylated-DNA--[protein]-cysteine S-methyltransferase [Saezia sp.]